MRLRPLRATRLRTLWKSACGATGKSVADTCRGVTTAPRFTRVPHIVVLVLQTMTLNSTSGSSSIFQGGKLKPGIYKIQNIYTDNYLDIEVHSRGMCCRPAKDLGEGRGLVSLCKSPVVHVSDDQKWEIKQLGVGYAVQRVSLPISSTVSHVNSVESG